MRLATGAMTWGREDSAVNEAYSLNTQDGRIVFRTVLYRSGSGSALNALVYNRELAVILISAALATGTYAALTGVLESALLRMLPAIAAFALSYGLLKVTLFRERITEMQVEPDSGTVKVLSYGVFGQTLTKILRLQEIRFLEAEEMPALDESDVSEIVKWHKMAEPGVHATPLPVFKLNLILADGTKVLIYTDLAMDRVLEVRQRLGRAMGLA